VLRLATWLDGIWPARGSVADTRRHGHFLSLFILVTLALLLGAMLLIAVRLVAAPDGLLAAPFLIVVGNLAVAALLWLWNRAGHSRWASFAYLAWLISGALVFVPADAVDRHLILFALPVIAASFILAPAASYGAAALCSLGYSLRVALSPGVLSFNPLFVLVIGLLAFSAWFVAAHLSRLLAAAQASQAQYQALVEQLPAFVYVTEFGREGRWLYASPQIEALLGYTPAEWLADPEIWHNRLHAEDAPGVAEAVALSRATGAPLHLEYRLAHRNGYWVWVRDEARVLRLPGQPPQLQGVIIDITPQREAEAAMHATQARDQALLAALPDLMFRLDAAGTYLDYHAPKGSRDLYVPPEQFLGRRLTEVLPPEVAECTLRALAEALCTGLTQVFEYTLPAPSGPSLYEARVVACGAAEVLIIVRNITQRRRAEVQIEASLREKEVLLREIHHRVKNNLQVMASLLSLQAEHVDHPAALAMLRDSQHRVRTMALVHEELYQSHDLAQIDFAAYIDRLTGYLLYVHGVGDTIALQLDISAAHFGVDTAIPCGLIVNELVSNALKYAFPNGRGGQLQVSLHPAIEGWRLEVADDGVGLPPSVDFRNSDTLGLQLVGILATQLHGTLALDRAHGTRFRVDFRAARRHESG
jgi:PAS domain S-box-containing protein